MPDRGSELVMDYAGKGQNKLLSSQKLRFDPVQPWAIERVEYVRRGPVDAPIVTTSSTYYPGGLD